MAQQFVQFANRPDPDYSALLNQTQQVAAREHEVAKRMAAQRALLQQMADRGDIKVPDGQMAVGRFGMEFDTPEARKAYINSQTPEQKDLTRNDAAYSTQEVVQTAQDVAREAGAAASDAHNAMNPQMRESAQLALIQQKLAVEQSLRQAGNPGRPWVQGSLEDQPKMPDPGPNQQIATNALRDIIGMQPKPEGQPAPVVPGTGVLSPVEIGKRQAQAEAAAETPNTSQSATSKSGTAESRSARDSSKVSMTPVNFNMDVTDRTKTVSSSGMQFYDEVKETLPSLRKAAAIETISAMFGGRDTNSPGQFSALATQREKDLATYNERLAKSGTSTVYGGGLSKLSTSGGQTSMDVSDATAGSNNITLDNSSRSSNTNGGRGENVKGPKAVTFQGLGGGNVEGVEEYINGIPYVGGIKNEIGLFGFATKGGTEQLGEIYSRATDLSSAGFKVKIDENSLKTHAGKRTRDVIVDGKPLLKLEYDTQKSTWSVLPIRGARIPSAVLAGLTGNEVATDDITRNNRPEATLPSR